MTYPSYLVDQAVALTKQGQSALQISVRLGVPTRTIQRWRRREGVAQPARANTPITPDRLAQAEALLDEGLSCSEISRTLHMSPETLHHHFPGRGWSTEDSIRFAIAVRQANRKMRRAA